MNERIHFTAMEKLAIFCGSLLMLMLAFHTVAPYFLTVKSPDLIRQIDQNQNTVQNLALILFGFLFGASVGNRMKDSTIETLAKTAQTAGAALPGASPEALTIAPGEAAKVTAAETGGAEIRPE